MSKIRHLMHIPWDELQKLDIKEKAEYFNIKGRPYHVLVAQQFDRQRLDALGNLATCIRRAAKSKAGMRFLGGLLDHKRAMLYFTQPSTRTFLSFYAACQILGVKTAEVRDASTSSEMKGESPEDTVRTFSSYFDMIVMRSPLQGFAEKTAWVLSNSERPVPILNAGSGKDQHPTQALLDIYTLQRSFERTGGIEGKKIAFVGDLARGRTVRSLAYLLTRYDGVRLYFIAPPPLQVGRDILDQLDVAGVPYEQADELDRILPEVDAVYMTRIQDEWDKSPGESGKLDTSRFRIDRQNLDTMKLNAVIMHPLPRRQEIDTAVDSDPRAMYWRQMRNGMWIRVALIATIFGLDAEILNYYEVNLG